MLTVTGLGKVYGRRAVLEGVSFTVRSGLVTGLLGPNGSGKSTAIHIMTGLVQASSGSVCIGEDSVSSSLYRQRIGLCPDDLAQPDLLTGREYLAMVQGIRGVAVADTAITHLVAGMRLTHAMDALLGTYSHGMKRKIQIVAGILHLPEVLILDEPFRGLDPESTEIVRSLLTTYAAQGNAVLISTHDLLVAGKLCDQVVVLRNGRMVADATPAALMESSGNSTLEESFLAVTGLASVAGESAEQFLTGLDLLAL